MMNPFERLNLTFPIFQAPIGSIASPELAAASSTAGGLGHLACTWLAPHLLPQLFERMSALTDRSWGSKFRFALPH